MKKFFYLVVIAMAALVVIPSCKSKEGKETLKVNKDSLENLELRDSMATIQAERDTLNALMTDVVDGMNKITDLQQVMNIGNLNSETADKKTQLRNQVVAVQKMIVDSKKRLADLEKRLNNSTAYNDEMKKQVQVLKKQLENQQSVITSLTAELQAAHVQIGTLNTRVDSLNTVNTQTRAELTTEKQKVEEQQARNTALTNEMNECFYVVGSKAELKAQKIIETGFLRKTKVMEGDYTKSYFTKADKRSLTRIELHNKKAEVMSKHPAGSYVIEDVNGQKVLRITNPTKFWELSNYLVIKVG